MNKSIKFKNNVYLDSNSIMYGRTLLSSIIGNRFATRMLPYISDGQTKTWTLDAWGSYLFINAHCYKRAVALISVNDDVKIFHVDVIFKSEDLAMPKFTYDFTTRVLTGVVATGVQCRGNMFKLNVIL